jgi:mannosyl-oligosaccharide glucosidase
VARAFALDTVRLGGAPLSGATRRFAGAVLGAQLGSLGYFYGTTSVAGPDGREIGRTSPAPLLSVVPSRPFFPRGFLWDDGFHQLLVGVWKPAIANDVLAHWMHLMHSDGWIPREQILGAEAEARVPAEFMPQHRQHANPPTLMLRLERLLNGGAEQGGEEEWLPLARRLWPRLTRWYGWLVRTQAGELPHTFRWRGRDVADNRLNALTLSSGLDDFPRATVPTKKERHVDMLCWVAFCSRLLGRLAARLEMPEEAAAYEAAHAHQLEALLLLHWNEKLQAFNDWGLQASAGEFVEHVVVKCGTPDGSASVEHDVPASELQQGGAGPKCPRKHPRFLFPLGDGAGGLQMRERFKATKQREGWVEHLGYVSLFPLMLRLLPADAPQLPPLLELLRDPKAIWTPYGLRSLAASDRFYLRPNAPGDAPYWRGAIWINLNYLVLSGLHHYAHTAGPAQARAAELYDELRTNLVTNMQRQWEETGYLWEQYNQDTGAGQRNRPFAGWSALVLLAIAEIY